MKKINGLKMDYNMFKDVVKNATDNGANVECENGECFFTFNQTLNTHIKDEDIIKDIEKYCECKVSDIVVDMNTDSVVIIVAD